MAVTRPVRRPEPLWGRRGQGRNDLLYRCGQYGVAFVRFFAIAGDGGEADAAQADASAHRATPAQIRLAWTLNRGPHVLAIPGTGNLEHLTENIAAGAIRLSTEELKQLP
jgi:pyridoxine 4-dehydrogenase